MLISLFIFLITSSFAQELELNTKDIHAYAQIKNCLDFSVCSPYEETLRKDQEVYRWKVKFSEPISIITSAMSDCRISNTDYSLLLRSEEGKVLPDFKIMLGTKNEKQKVKYFPMELRKEAYTSLKRKEASVESLLKSSEPLPAMQSAVFEFEYSLEEYKLKSGSLPPKVLGRTHHFNKDVTYDLSKWDGSVCRFYQVMRHEVQHVKNVREIYNCRGRHHFVKNHNDDISVYVNDLSFIKNFCPEDKALYRNVESVLFAMYEGKEVQVGCSEGGPHKTENKRVAQSEKTPKMPRFQSASEAIDQLKKLYQKALFKHHPDSWKRRPTGNEPLPQTNPALR